MSKIKGFQMGNGHTASSRTSLGYTSRKFKSVVNPDKVSSIIEIIFRNKGCIYGGFVYKHLLHGGQTSDLDVVMNAEDINKAKAELVTECGCIDFSRPDNPINVILCPGAIVDISESQHFMSHYNRTNSFFQNVLWTGFGYRYIRDVIKDSKINPKELEDYPAEREIYINYLKNRQYQKWSDMRMKDHDYLKDWTVV